MPQKAAFVYDLDALENCLIQFPPRRITSWQFRSYGLGSSGPAICGKRVQCGGNLMETATPSFRQNEFEVRTEEQVEKLVGDIGRVIRNAEPARRAGLKELAETLLHQEIVTIAEEAGAAEMTAPRTRSNPLAAGILLAALGLGLAIIVPFVGLTLAAIGVILVLWGGVISWSRK